MENEENKNIESRTLDQDSDSKNKCKYGRFRRTEFERNADQTRANMYFNGNLSDYYRYCIDNAPLPPQEKKTGS